MSTSPFQFAWQWKTGMYQYKIFWVFNGKRTSSFLSGTFSWQHGRIASCTSLISCFPWAAKLAWDKRQHRQHLIFPMRWLRFWHFATLHGLEDLPVLVIWVLLWSALFLSLMIATAAQRSRVFVPHLYCGLAGSSRTSRTIKPSFWILFDKASVFMDLCTGTTTAPLGDKCHKENGTNVSSQTASDPAGFRSQCYDQIRWFCHENWISVCCIHMSQFLSIFHGIVQTNACRPLALTCHHAQSIRQRNMMNRLLLPQVSYCQDWEGSLRASRANSCPPGKKPRTWWQQHGRIASCTSLINCFPWAAKLAWDKRQHRQHLIFPMRWLRFWHFATLHGLEDLPVLVIWVLLWSAPFLSLRLIRVNTFAPWGNECDPQAVQHQLQEQEAATGSATLPTLSLQVWILLLLLIIMPGFDFGRMDFCKSKCLWSCAESS